MEFEHLDVIPDEGVQGRSGFFVTEVVQLHQFLVYVVRVTRGEVRGIKDINPAPARFNRKEIRSDDVEQV